MCQSLICAFWFSLGAVLLPTSASSGISRRDESGGSVSNMLAEFKSVEFSYEELSAATDNFSLSYKIGQGGFASVYLGVIHGQVFFPPIQMR